MSSNSGNHTAHNKRIIVGRNLKEAGANIIANEWEFV